MYCLVSWHFYRLNFKIINNYFDHECKHYVRKIDVQFTEVGENNLQHISTFFQHVSQFGQVQIELETLEGKFHIARRPEVD